MCPLLQSPSLMGPLGVNGLWHDFLLPEDLRLVGPRLTSDMIGAPPWSRFFPVKWTKVCRWLWNEWRSLREVRLHPRTLYGSLQPASPTSISFSLSHFIYFVNHFFLSSFFSFLLCVLQICYLDNLLCNVPVLAGTLHYQFFTSNVIDSISNLDREVSRDGSVTFGKLPVSKTFFACIQPFFSFYC
jgi:hypothetical protein